MANPALPPGFVLDDDDTPPLPAGFVVEQPKRTAATQVAERRKPSANNSDLAQLITGKKPAKRQPATYNFTGIPDVSTQLGGALDAFQHHVLSPVHGVAQFVEHGLGKLGVISPDTVAQDDRALRQREADYQARTDGNVGAYLGAVPGEVLPWMLGIGELKAAGLLPKLAATKDVVGLGAKAGNIAAKGGLLAAEGAAYGLSQPVLGEGSYGAQKGAQVALNAAVAPLTAGTLKAGGAVIGAGRRGARYLTEHGREAIADERLAKLYGSDAQVLQMLRGGSRQPGYDLTPAQVLGTPEAVQTERGLRNNGLTAPAFAAQESANNAALRDDVARLAGTDADTVAAKAARKAATDPYYAQLPGQRVDVAPILAQLDGLNNSSLGVRPNIKSAASSLRAEIESRIGSDGKIGADVLSGLHENAGSHLGPMASAQEKAALGPLRHTIADTLDAAVPGYRANLAAYARASQPLTDMANGRALLGAIDSGTRDAGSNQAVSLTQIKSILSKDDRAKFKMSPQARQQLEAIRETLQQRSVTNNTIAASGPGTAADALRGLGQSPLLQRLIGQMSGVAGGTLGATLGPAGSAAGYGLGLMAGEGLNAANNAVVKKVGQKAASARLAADAIEAHQRRLQQQSGGGLLNGMPAYLLPYLNP